ncbi:hypothetical protein EV359DRAFT_69016 [Lentinula novae-zelandiae]|nr:hypothetical protein EV359DRAFT_69016 [Lentinula novae-zelandiae]
MAALRNALSAPFGPTTVSTLLMGVLGSCPVLFQSRAQLIAALTQDCGILEGDGWSSAASRPRGSRRESRRRSRCFLDVGGSALHDNRKGGDVAQVQRVHLKPSRVQVLGQALNEEEEFAGQDMAEESLRMEGVRVRCKAVGVNAAGSLALKFRRVDVHAYLVQAVHSVRLKSEVYSVGLGGVVWAVSRVAHLREDRRPLHAESNLRMGFVPSVQALNARDAAHDADPWRVRGNKAVEGIETHLNNEPAYAKIGREQEE